VDPAQPIQKQSGSAGAPWREVRKIKRVVVLDLQIRSLKHKNYFRKWLTSRRREPKTDAVHHGSTPKISALWFFAGAQQPVLEAIKRFVNALPRERRPTR
jgi:hypothetical protein